MPIAVMLTVALTAAPIPFGHLPIDRQSGLPIVRSDQEVNVTLVVGQKVQFVVPEHVSRIALSGSGIYDLQSIGSDRLLLIAVSPGRSSIIAWTNDDKRVSLNVEVK